MKTIIIFAVVVLLAYMSVRQRVQRNLRRKEWDNIGERKKSPFSVALTNLVGTAGGIYLSLVMLATFLELDIPSKVSLINIHLEPLAAISLVLAIVQPFVMSVLGR
ncbi:MAG: hypothetical protein FH758_15605 [Firmicutes bacterium]|nr:hypothetical protein [Bacillota bacterium]